MSFIPATPRIIRRENPYPHFRRNFRRSRCNPALAVEIVSESNTADEIAGIVETYLTNGASEVWILYPNRGQLWPHTHDGHAEKHSATLVSSLLGGTVLDLAQLLA